MGTRDPKESDLATTDARVEDLELCEHHVGWTMTGFLGSVARMW